METKRCSARCVLAWTLLICQVVLVQMAHASTQLGQWFSEISLWTFGATLVLSTVAGLTLVLAQVGTPDDHDPRPLAVRVLSVVLSANMAGIIGYFIGAWRQLDPGLWAALIAVSAFAGKPGLYALSRMLTRRIDKA